MNRFNYFSQIKPNMFGLLKEIFSSKSLKGQIKVYIFFLLTHFLKIWAVDDFLLLNMFVEN